VLECLNCGKTFDPTRYRWRCPASGMKDTCCEEEPCPLRGPPPAVHPLASLAPPWTTPGHGQPSGARCHRFVYDPDGTPDNCPEPTVTSGWRRDAQGRWYAVDACAAHHCQLVSRPRRGGGLGR